jgi:hypothetical protein
MPTLTQADAEITPREGAVKIHNHLLGGGRAEGLRPTRPRREGRCRVNGP